MIITSEIVEFRHLVRHRLTLCVAYTPGACMPSGTLAVHHMVDIRIKFTSQYTAIRIAMCERCYRSTEPVHLQQSTNLLLLCLPSAHFAGSVVRDAKMQAPDEKKGDMGTFKISQ